MFVSIPFTSQPRTIIVRKKLDSISRECDRKLRVLSVYSDRFRENVVRHFKLGRANYLEECGPQNSHHFLMMKELVIVKMKVIILRPEKIEFKSRV